jgi:hypothetical protein
MMTNPIARLYETEQQARDAVSRLREEGFSADSIFLVAPGSGGEGGVFADLSAAIATGRVLGRSANLFAERVQRGRSLVVIEAPFGHGQRATEIMDSQGPVDTDVRLVSEPVPSRAAPLSTAWGWPVLSYNKPAPFSDFLGFQTLSRGRSILSRIFGELASPHFAFFSMFPMLTRSGAPMFAKGALSHRPAPLSSMFGLPLLSTGPAPLSSAAGLPLLSSRPAPLSSMFGLPVLSRYL